MGYLQTTFHAAVHAHTCATSLASPEHVLLQVWPCVPMAHVTERKGTANERSSHVSLWTWALHKQPKQKPRINYLLQPTQALPFLVYVHVLQASMQDANQLQSKRLQTGQQATAMPASQLTPRHGSTQEQVTQIGTSLGCPIGCTCAGEERG